MSDIKEILSKYKTIAMVGVSNDPTKVDALVGSLLTPTIAIVLYFERISLISLINYL